MSNKSKTTSGPPQHIIWRWVLLAAILVGDLAFHVISRSGGSIKLFNAFRLVPGMGVYAAAAVMAYQTARHFGHGEKTRRIWLILALLGVTGVIVDFGNYGPIVTGMYPGARAVLVAGFALITLSVLLLTWALWMMVKIYRSTGMHLRLSKIHYAAMVFFAALGVASVVLLPITMRAQHYLGAYDLIGWIQRISLPRPPAYLLCAVFGVMIWRYAKQMGGGLVAKAWWTVLLYTVISPLRAVLLGFLLPLFPYGSNWNWTLGEVSAVGFAMAGYMLYLGASYQYQACTQEVPVEIDEEELKIVVGV